MKYLSTWVTDLPQSGIRKIFHAALKYKDVVHLEIGDPDFSLPNPLLNSIYQALTEGYTHYTHNAGLYELREAVSQYYLDRYNVRFNPENNIVVTAGSTEALTSVLLATLNPGEEVLIPDPGYPSYQAMIRIARGKASTYVVREENKYNVDPGDILSSITSRTKVIILNNPHNPTGSVTQLKPLKEVVEEAYRKGIVVIADEVYENIVFENSNFESLAKVSEFDNVVIANSASKSFAATGLRIGFLLSTNKELIETITKLQEGLIACAPAPFQKALAEVIKAKGYVNIIRDMVKEYKIRRDALVSTMRRIPEISFYEPEGTFYMFINISKVSENSEAFAEELLKAERVAVAPGIAFGRHGEGHIRISFASSLDSVISGAQRILRFINRVLKV